MDIRHLEATGISPGWQCWEVGAGGGSIAAWLGERSGKAGHVLVTDIDPRFLVELATLDQPTIEIELHDIVADPVPAQTFDLIHARLVLTHLPARELALQRMVTALKPGGWLVLDDYDLTLFDRSYPTTNAEASALFQTMHAAQDRLMEIRGSISDGGGACIGDYGRLGLPMSAWKAMWPSGKADPLVRACCVQTSS